MVERIVGADLNGPVDQFHRVVVSAGLMGDHAEEMQGIRMIRIHLKDLLVNPSRVIKSPGLVMLHPHIQDILNRLWLVVCGLCLVGCALWAVACGLTADHRQLTTSDWPLAPRPWPIAPLLPHLPICGFHGPGKGLGVAERGILDVLSQRGPEVFDFFGLLGQLDGFGDVVCLGFGDEVGLSGAIQDARAHPTHMPISGPGDDRNPHPECVTGGGGAVVRKGIQRDIHPVIHGEMASLGGEAGHHHDPLNIDLMLQEHVEIVMSDGRVRQLPTLEKEMGPGDLGQNLRPHPNRILIHLAQIVE